MAPTALNAMFSDALNVICKAWNTAEESDIPVLNMCVSQARGLLKEPAISSFHRLKTLLLLARMVDDYNTALRYRRQADIALCVARSEVIGGTSAAIDTSLDRLQEELDELRDILAEEAREAEDTRAAEEAGVDNVESSDPAYHSNSDD